MTKDDAVCNFLQCNVRRVVAIGSNININNHIVIPPFISSCLWSDHPPEVFLFQFNCILSHLIRIYIRQNNEPFHSLVFHSLRTFRWHQFCALGFYNFNNDRISGDNLPTVFTREILIDGFETEREKNKLWNFANCGLVEPTSVKSLH